MASGNLREFDRWRSNNPQMCFVGLLSSGSLLMGSSIAYPMLSLDNDAWALVALSIFFPSAGLFNTFKIPEIYLYGHYTLAMCIVAMILNLAFGQIPLPDHARFIPVYVMGSTFLTAAWPSLFQSIGLLPKTLDDMAAAHGYMPVPMSEVHVDDDTSQNMTADAPNPRSSLSDWPSDQVTQGSPPLLVSTSTSSEPGDSHPSIVSLPRPETVPDIVHMGPSSNYSGGTSDTGTSLSLSSQSDYPSELSSNVANYFFQGTAAFPSRGTTQRRRDINSLGRQPYGRARAHNRTREAAWDSIDLIDTTIRKTQSM